MTHFDYKDIFEMAKTAPDAALRLHWEGSEDEPVRTTPARILQDVADGDYSTSDFDRMGYCTTEADYQAEQAEA